MRLKSFGGACAALLVLSVPAAANVEYQCGALNGISFLATYFDEEDVIGVDATNQASGAVDRAILTPVVSGSGSRFFDGRTGLDFVEHQGRATLTTASGTIFNCVEVAVTVPGGGGGGGVGDAFDDAGNPIAQTFGPFNGISFGGNLRAGAGVNFPDVGSTFEGQQLTLENDTGVYFNGYSWWRVTLQNGQQAFQWGGLLCSPGNLLVGVFNEGC